MSKQKMMRGYVTARYMDEKWFKNFTVTKSKTKSGDIPVIVIADQEAYESFFVDSPYPTYKELADELSEARAKITKLDKSNRILKEAYDLLKGDPECEVCGTTEFLCGHNKR